MNDCKFNMMSEPPTYGMSVGTVYLYWLKDESQFGYCFKGEDASIHRGRVNKQGVTKSAWKELFNAIKSEGLLEFTQDTLKELIKAVDYREYPKKSFARRLLKSMTWFFISAAIVLLITVGLSHFSTNSLGQNTLYLSVVNHKYFWLCFRAFIVIGFVLLWPVLVKHWAKKYSWSEEHVKGLAQRRWRFAIWLIVIDLTFQLL